MAPTLCQKRFHCFVKSSKFWVIRTIRFCSNFISMWSQYLSNNVRRDFKLPMSASAIISNGNIKYSIGKSIFIVWRNSTNTWFWRMQRIFLSFLDIFDLLNPNPNDASAYMLSVLRFGWKNAVFGQKNMFLACFKAFTLFSLSMRIDNNFLNTISGDSTTYSL